MYEMAASDIFALALFIGSILTYGWMTRHGPLKHQNIAAGVYRERQRWIETMIHREQRMVDLIILTGLGQGNAFFASTAIVIVGALAAAIGTNTGFDSLLAELPFASETPPALLHFKMVFIMVIFLIAFFKFAWAFRLTHYTSIMMGALPILDENNIEECRAYGRRLVDLSSLAGEHSNGGLHTYYYGIAACGWFISPYVFVAATIFILLVLYRREHHSRGQNRKTQKKGNSIHSPGNGRDFLVTMSKLLRHCGISGLELSTIPTYRTGFNEQE
jgi:uncharacterized membrane protein